MSKINNRVQIIGNIGNNPELKVVSTGKLTKLAVAVNEYKRNRKGETSKKTYWHNIIVWGKLAELVHKHTKKGAQILVDGKLVNRSYTDKSGKVKSVTEVVAREIIVNYTKQAA